MSEYDWVMEGLKQYNHEFIGQLRVNPNKKITLQDIASWALGREEYSENQVLTNARRLARYIKSHRFMVIKLAGFTEAGKYGNREAYRLNPIE